MSCLVFELKKTKLELATTKQLKLDLAVTEKAQDSSYPIVTQAQNVAASNGFQRDKALYDLAKL